MFGIDLTTVLVILAVFIVLFLVIDFLFAGGGMTGAAMQCGAAIMGSPYGWTLIVAIVVIVLVAFGMLFGAR